MEQKKLELQEIRTELGRVSEENSQMTKDLTAKDSALQSLTNESAQKDSQLQSAYETLDSLRMELHELQEELKHMQNKPQEEYKAKLEELEHQLKETKAASLREVSALREELEHRKEELLRLQSQLLSKISNTTDRTVLTSGML